jgi:hypothetical protein
MAQNGLFHRNVPQPGFEAVSPVEYRRAFRKPKPSLQRVLDLLFACRDRNRIDDPIYETKVEGALAPVEINLDSLSGTMSVTCFKISTS